MDGENLSGAIISDSETENSEPFDLASAYFEETLMIVSFKLQYARRQCVVCYAETPDIVSLPYLTEEMNLNECIVCMHSCYLRNHMFLHVEVLKFVCLCEKNKRFCDFSTQQKP